jgi:protein-S-isoprenylcysteine O-methyltransferase Ste14
MKSLRGKAVAGLVNLTLLLAAALFLPAWTLRYWQAWVCLVVFAACAAGITVYLMRRDPELLERRLRAGPGAEKEPSQKVIQALAGIVFLALFVFPALDHRLGWSHVPAIAAISGDVLMVAGFSMVSAVFRENTYTSGTIEVAAGQTVIATGPYAIVRHPMYSGALVLLAGIPVALGSWWGLWLVLPIVAAIVWRLLDEERFLARNLAGYPEYCARVRRRLLPGVW